MDTNFIPSDVQTVMATLQRAGFSVWLVGGALRDVLRGELPQDWDLTTEATPQQIVTLFDRVVPIGIRHGTVQIHTAHRDIEATSTAVPGRQGMLQDLSRRDFTINAMALDFPSGELLDPHGGQQDLQVGRLRAVEDPAARFREDPLRTLRAGRFMSTLGFELHPATRSALPQAAPGLAKVAQERIRDEMLKLLQGAHSRAAMLCLKEGGVLLQVLPELLEGMGSGTTLEDRFHHTLATMEHTPSRQRVRLAALLHALGATQEPRLPRAPGSCADHRYASAKQAAAVMLRWRMSRKEMVRTAHVIENQLPWAVDKWTDAAARHWIAAAGIHLLEDLFDLATADCLATPGAEAFLQTIAERRNRVNALLQQPLALRIRDLAINGNEVTRMLELTPGPWLGKLLRELHRMVLDDPTLNQPQTLRKIVRRIHARKP